jgi:hypothetical protein
MLNASVDLMLAIDAPQGRAQPIYKEWSRQEILAIKRAKRALPYEQNFD